MRVVSRRFSLVLKLFNLLALGIIAVLTFRCHSHAEWKQGARPYGQPPSVTVAQQRLGRDLYSEDSLEKARDPGGSTMATSCASEQTTESALLGTKSTSSPALCG